MKFALALAIAAHFWTHHGVPTPCHPQPISVSDAQFAAWELPGAYAASYPWPTDCVIYLSPNADADRTFYPAGYCQAIVHEVSVIDGIPENTPGLPVTDTIAGDNSMPGACMHWRAWRRAHWGY